jgi:hypothetical protein
VDFYFPHEGLTAKLHITTHTTIDDALRDALLKFSEEKIIDLDP